MQATAWLTSGQVLSAPMSFAGSVEDLGRTIPHALAAASMFKVF